MISRPTAASRRALAVALAAAAALAPSAAASASRTAVSRSHRLAAAAPAARAAKAPTAVLTGTPFGCLLVGGLINPHQTGRATWEGFDQAYAAGVSVRGPYSTAAAASAAARDRGRGGFARVEKRYVVAAPMGSSMATQVKAVAACLGERKHRIGFVF